MERATRFIKERNVVRELLSDEEMVRAIWASAVGKTISAHTAPAKIVRTTLIVEVEDSIWQKQLHTLSAQIKERIQRLLGHARITEIEFRIAIPRRSPARVETRRSEAMATSQDEADRIEDPVLKKVYQLSRKKATA